jgi:calcineurin-like phosphoesterase family protein
MLYFTGDTHFSDPRVLRIDRRPFSTIAEHDEALIAKWNEIVGPDDVVWHLGDFARGSAAAVDALLSRLQ